MASLNKTIKKAMRTMSSKDALEAAKMAVALENKEAARALQKAAKLLAKAEKNAEAVGEKIDDFLKKAKEIGQQARKAMRENKTYKQASQQIKELTVNLKGLLVALEATEMPKVVLYATRLEKEVKLGRVTKTYRPKLEKIRDLAVALVYKKIVPYVEAALKLMQEASQGG